jgi:hypothetical protein
MPDPSENETDDPEPEAVPEHQPDQTIVDERAWTERHIDEQEEESFPASDPHADWSGPSV